MVERGFGGGRHEDVVVDVDVSLFLVHVIYCLYSALDDLPGCFGGGLSKLSVQLSIGLQLPSLSLVAAALADPRQLHELLVPVPILLQPADDILQGLLLPGVPVVFVLCTLQPFALLRH